MNSEEHQLQSTSQPKFSAFALMILLLLIIFAFISKVNILLENSDKHIFSISNSNTIAESDLKKVVKKVEDTLNQSKQEMVNVGAAILDGNTIEEYNTPTNNSRKDNVVDKNTQENKEYYPIVPSKPQKGDRLGGILVAKKDFIPANSKSSISTTPPIKKHNYRSAPSVKSISFYRPQKYVIRKNDTLWSIAKKTTGKGSNWKKIVKLNPGLSPSRLTPGMKIKIIASKTNSFAWSGNSF